MGMYDYNPPVIHRVYQRKAEKFHTCEVCGSDIIPGDHYYTYKPLPKRISKGKYKAEKWRKRCIDHKPKKYDEADFYYEGHMIRSENDNW